MAYEKLAGPPKAISFYFTMAELFSSGSLWTMYKASHNGGDAVDLFAVTEDELDIYNQILSDGVFDILDRFLKYTTGITDAIIFNGDYTPSGGSSEKSVVLKVLDHEVYNDNYLKPLSALLEKCMRFYVIKEWALIKDQDESAAERSYARNVAELLRQSVRLKMVPITI